MRNTKTACLFIFLTTRPSGHDRKWQNVSVPASSPRHLITFNNLTAATSYEFTMVVCTTAKQCFNPVNPQTIKTLSGGMCHMSSSVNDSENGSFVELTRTHNIELLNNDFVLSAVLYVW